MALMVRGLMHIIDGGFANLPSFVSILAGMTIQCYESYDVISDKANILSPLL